MLRGNMGTPTVTSFSSTATRPFLGTITQMHFPGCDVESLRLVLLPKPSIHLHWKCLESHNRFVSNRLNQQQRLKNIGTMLLLKLQGLLFIRYTGHPFALCIVLMDLVPVGRPLPVSLCCTGLTSLFVQDQANQG